jgi:hypothetical protein
VQRLELYKLAKLFYDGRCDSTFLHIQFREISERDDGIYDFFERLIDSYDIVIIIDFAAPVEKTQLLYKRRKEKGMGIPGIDSLAELWDWDINDGINFPIKRVTKVEG